MFYYWHTRVSETKPLYDILNEFQKGLSHMAVVIRQRSGAIEHSFSKLSNNGEHVGIFHIY